MGPLSTIISLPSFMTATLSPRALAKLVVEVELLALLRPGVIQPPEAVKPADQILFIPVMPWVECRLSFSLAKAGSILIPLAAAVEANRDCALG
jgi:hypothetical protein